MMIKNLLTAFLTFTIALSAIAEVPSLINYQGKLTGLRYGSGTPTTLTVCDFTVRIFDQKTFGKLIYQEYMEPRNVYDGVYSFGFGENGYSILDFSESLIVEEAGKQVFDYALTKDPVDESLSIEAGDYNWNEKTGSSDAANLLVQYDKNNKSAKVIFLNGSPDKDSKIIFNYGIKEDGIIPAFASSQNNWLELTFKQYGNGTRTDITLSPRERLVSVPFALKASVASQLSKPIGETVFMKHGERVHGGGNITKSEIDIRSTTSPNSNLAGSWHYFQFRFHLLDDYRYLSFKTNASFGYPSGVSSLDESMLKKINSSIYAYPNGPNGRFISDENMIFLTSDGFSQETQLINPGKGEYVIYFKMKKISEFPDLNKDISYHGPISVIVKGLK